MIVATGADWLGKDDTGRVNGLENVQKVTSACDLFDQDGGKAFVAQLLMYAEKVDLGAAKHFGAYAEGDGDAGDERYKFFGTYCSYPDVPIRTPAGRFQCPTQRSA